MINESILILLTKQDEEIKYSTIRKPKFSKEDYGKSEQTYIYKYINIGVDNYVGSLKGRQGILLDVFKCKEFGYKLEQTKERPSTRERWDLQTGKMEPWLEPWQKKAEEDKGRKNNYFKETLERAEKEGIPGREIIGYCDIVSMVDWVIKVKNQDPNPEDIKKVVRKAFAWDYTDEVLGRWTRDVAPTFPLLMKTLQAYLEFVVDVNE